MKTRIVGLALVALLLLAPLQIALAGTDTSAEILVSNAKRLQQLVHYRNTVISSTLNVTSIGSNWTLILNLTLQADLYLNASIQALNAGNYTEAKIYAIKAINTYGQVLELQEELAEEYDIHFKLEGEIEEGYANATKLGVNASIAINRTALTLQLEVLENRVDLLLEVLGKVNTSLYNVSGAISLLQEAKLLLEEAEAKLEAGNITVPELAKTLAVVKKILGLVNAELHRASLALTVNRAMKLGLLKKNETLPLNMSPLINHTKIKVKGLKGNLTERLEELEEELNETAAKIAAGNVSAKEVKKAGKQLEKELKEVEKKLNEVFSRVENKIATKAKEKGGWKHEIKVEVKEKHGQGPQPWTPSVTQGESEEEHEEGEGRGRGK
ncbi:hypothetical protein [Thermofilum pendens]|uniref:Uncharacterized protein n=1 Tax=Thermofilum pendens (strain DSM 2475 / Hrk 5) TaxID=368408 RepID=A1RZ88_THEPD|nr:hypothetical protein [Thermofilum pendens]ABL78518.1 hypothetical protein Tpen_1120 [Thermofilum pendens Hrk 5]